jgi:hypothetical protein
LPDDFTTEDIRNVRVEAIPNTGAEPSKELQAVTDPLAQVKTEKGWIGHVFGARSEKSGNVAGILVLVGLGIIAFAYFAQKPPGQVAPAFPAKDFVGAIVSLITLALGYLFGRNSRPD